MRRWISTHFALFTSLLGAFVTLGSNPSHAETVAPQGIYVAYGRALNERILQAPYLAGVLVRVPWREVEPAEGPGSRCGLMMEPEERFLD